MNSKEHDPIKKSIDTKQIYRIVPPILFLVSTITATITFTTAYNTSTGYIQDSFQKILLYATVIVGIALSICSACFAKRCLDVSNAQKIFFSERIDLVGHLISSIVLVLCTVFALVKSDDIIFLVGNTAEKVLKSVLIASVIIFFLFDRALWQKNKNRDAFSLISNYAAIIFCIAAIAILYFDVSVEMNNPQKLFIQFSLAAFCLSTLADAKLLANGNGFFLFIASKTCLSLLCPIAAISAFGSYFTNDKAIPHFYFFIAVALAVRAIFETVNLLCSSIKENIQTE